MCLSSPKYTITLRRLRHLIGFTPVLSLIFFIPKPYHFHSFFGERKYQITDFVEITVGGGPTVCSRTFEYRTAKTASP